MNLEETNEKTLDDSKGSTKTMRTLIARRVKKTHTLRISTCSRTTLPVRARFKEQGIVIVAVIEVEVLLSLHESLLRQRSDFPRRRRQWKKATIDLLREEIVEWETGVGHGLARHAAGACSFITMEWPEWPMSGVFRLENETRTAGGWKEELKGCSYDGKQKDRKFGEQNVDPMRKRLLRRHWSRRE
ncbi:hypothetical protein EDD18DRAFT_1111020 [Armillaria luteobubalina]|uniref:Uncharacterized protein n=1 Tax=Armillaria luteobubalina TaxID=153913 RepID=A0AA39PM07_9AGAR|nr:hypothetical protein EDD18DRAFT_1111020 [Armillaria luteobubalina]